MADSVNSGMNAAKSKLQIEMCNDMADRFKNTPATESEVKKHGLVAAKTFLSTFNKKLRSYASEVVGNKQEEVKY